jgi:hypothetical protein
MFGRKLTRWIKESPIFVLVVVIVLGVI